MSTESIARKKSETRQKTETIGVRATPEEKEMLVQRARSFGISVGELVRRTIFETKPDSIFDQTVYAELYAVRANAGRIGGLLKGWLAGSFEGAEKPDFKEIRAMLEMLDSRQAEINAIIKKKISQGT